MGANYHFDSIGSPGAENGNDYSFYDTDSYLTDAAQWLWDAVRGVDHEAETQRRQRQQFEEAARDFYGPGVLLDDEAYRVYDTIAKNYINQQEKGLTPVGTILYGAGSDIYNAMTDSEEATKILTDIMARPEYYTDEEGNVVKGTGYTVGDILRDQLANGNIAMADDILATVGSDLQQSGRSWGETWNNANNSQINDFLNEMEGKFGRDSGYQLEGDLSGIVSGMRDSVMTDGYFDQLGNDLSVNANAKYNALTRSDDAARNLDMITGAIDLGTILIPGGVGFLSKAGKLGKLANAGNKLSDIATGANKASKAEKAAGIAKGEEAVSTAREAAANAKNLSNAAAKETRAANKSLQEASSVLHDGSKYRAPGISVSEFDRLQDAAKTAKANAKNARSNLKNANADLATSENNLMAARNAPTKNGIQESLDTRKRAKDALNGTKKTTRKGAEKYDRRNADEWIDTINKYDGAEDHAGISKEVYDDAVKNLRKFRGVRGTVGRIINPRNSSKARGLYNLARVPFAEDMVGDFGRFIYSDRPDNHVGTQGYQNVYSESRPSSYDLDIYQGVDPRYWG